VGRPPCGAWDGLAAAPQLLLIEAFTAEADVIETTPLSFAADPTQAHLHAHRASEEHSGHGGRRFNQKIIRVDWFEAGKSMQTPQTAGRRAISEAMIMAERRDLTDDAVAARAWALRA